MLAALDLNPFDIIGAPIKFLLDHLQQLFSQIPPFHAIGSFGLAVILTTILLRILLIPVFHWNFRILRRVQAEQRLLAPEILALRKRYRSDTKRLTAELQKLYQKHHISPFSGMRAFLPAIIQVPVIIALYGAIRLYSQSGAGGLNFLFLPNLAQSPLTLAKGIPGLITHPAFLLIPLLAAAATWLQARMMQLAPAPTQTPDAQKRAIQTRRLMLTLFPLFIFISALNFAAAIGLYWLTQSLFIVVQQFYLNGWGALPVPAWVPGAARHARRAQAGVAINSLLPPSPPHPILAPSAPTPRRRRRRH